ncbi:SecDF P1 head subdomain-containing protein [Mycolicibacterium sp. ELW1]|jgi:preprotein translocase subunit SecD|uniref:SecDF P1 head subdomain-containing protein n=1 Tax=Mycobacteriaceae TaxID=1762 RepID=UPI0011ECC2CE|nr:hypothetical protein [Mycobacterium sp. ELW1]QEN14567.1 hypothetical protein D3H54_16070 [Mycobacterium sp. ELW1]
MTDKSPRNRRIMIAVVAALAAAAIVVPVLGVLLTPGVLTKQQDAASMTTTTTTPPPLTIKPLSLRPVTGGPFVIRPGDCDPPPPTPPEAPLRICDIVKSAVYELGPQALTVQLTDVDSFLNPLTAKQMVQVTMTPESARAFADFTASHIDQQVAFVRSNLVVWAPKITERIDGEVLQLSGDVTEEQAREIARMLKDEA